MDTHRVEVFDGANDDAVVFAVADNFHFVYAQMKNLRRKLAEAGATVELKSVHGFGYKLSLPQSE